MGSVVVAGGLSSCGTWAWLPRGMWDLSSPTRDQTGVPCIARQVLNHWTTREVPSQSILARKLFEVLCFILTLHIKFVFYSITYCLLSYTWHPSPQPWRHSSKMYHIYQMTQVPPDTLSRVCIPEFEKHNNKIDALTSCFTSYLPISLPYIPISYSHQPHFSQISAKILPYPCCLFNPDFVFLTNLNFMLKLHYSKNI